jgi:hypothetical protein
VAGAVIVLPDKNTFEGAGALELARTDADGRFWLDMPFGDTAFTVGFGYKGRPIRGGRAVEGITVPAGETKDLGDVTVEAQE